MATEYIVKEKSPLIDFTNELINKKVSPIEDTVEELQKRVEEAPIAYSPNGTKYKITVDDTGTISATEIT